MERELIIIDQQQLQYENEILKITVLGGVRLEGLDSKAQVLSLKRNAQLEPG